jgi:hypothetical protein
MKLSHALPHVKKPPIISSLLHRFILSLFSALCPLFYRLIISLPFPSRLLLSPHILPPPHLSTLPLSLFPLLSSASPPLPHNVAALKEENLELRRRLSQKVSWSFFHILCFLFQFLCLIVFLADFTMFIFALLSSYVLLSNRLLSLIHPSSIPRPSIICSFACPPY